jgi:hypothetical protein
LQLSVLPLVQLHSLTLRTDQGFCSVDAVNDSHELFVATHWRDTYARDEIQRRSYVIAQSLNATFSRLRGEGALHG